MKLLGMRLVCVFCILGALSAQAEPQHTIEATLGSAANSHPISDAKADGIQFRCSPEQLDSIESGMEKYLESLNISSKHFVKTRDDSHHTLSYTLNTPNTDQNTIDLSTRPEYEIQDELIVLPAKNHKTRTVKTVSKKEIVLALMQHGRLTQFKGAACELDAFTDHVGIRQNTVAWSQRLEWGWPENKTAEGHAIWNKKIWDRGTPKPGIPPHVAFMDAFLHQDKYAIGCYTAAKLVMAQGALDYYARVKPDPKKLKIVEDRLNLDKDPLVDIEPGEMWKFEKDFNPQDLKIKGKILKIQRGVAGKNLIPGDWYYIWNTDPITYQKTGYEGSNSIYLGRNQVDDFYNDTYEGYYTHDGKINEVYQWRHHVFNHVRDAHKAEKLTKEKLQSLMETPEKGGLTMDMRVFPYFFGYEELP